MTDASDELGRAPWASRLARVINKRPCVTAVSASLRPTSHLANALLFQQHPVLAAGPRLPPIAEEDDQVGGDTEGGSGRENRQITPLRAVFQVARGHQDDFLAVAWAGLLCYNIGLSLGIAARFPAPRCRDRNVQFHLFCCTNDPVPPGFGDSALATIRSVRPANPDDVPGVGCGTEMTRFAAKWSHETRGNPPEE